MPLSVVSTPADLLLASGRGLDGELGDGKRYESSSMVSVAFDEEFLSEKRRVVRVVGGKNHILALTDDGNVYSWGRGVDLCLGHGSRNDEMKPRIVEALSTIHVIDCDCGSFHSACVSEDGTMYTWGMGREGQLGHGDFKSRPVPTPVVHLSDTRIITVACGDSHTLALSENGSLFAWGWNANGRLGLGDVQQRTVPCKIPVFVEDGDKVVDISCGWRHSLALTANGFIFSWGWNGFGQLGVGDFIDRLHPSLVLIPTEDASDVWEMSDEKSRLDRSDVSDTILSPFVSPKTNIRPSRSESNFDMIRSSQHEMARVQGSCDKETWTRIQNSSSVLPAQITGNPSINDEQTLLFSSHSSIPQSKSMPSFQGIQCDADSLENENADVLPRGNELSESGRYCFNTKSSHPANGDAFGDEDSNRYYQIFSASHRHVRCLDLAAGDRSSVAVSVSGTVYTWGDGSSGQLGVDISSKLHEIPPEVIEDQACAIPISVQLFNEYSPERELSITFRRVTCGAFHVLALADSGYLFGWGSNEFGQLGSDSSEIVHIPTLIENDPSRTLSIAGIGSGACTSFMIIGAAPSIEALPSPYVHQLEEFRDSCLRDLSSGDLWMDITDTELRISHRKSEPSDRSDVSESAVSFPVPSFLLCTRSSMYRKSIKRLGRNISAKLFPDYFSSNSGHRKSSLSVEENLRSDGLLSLRDLNTLRASQHDFLENQIITVPLSEVLLPSVLNDCNVQSLHRLFVSCLASIDGTFSLDSPGDPAIAVLRVLFTSLHISFTAEETPDLVKFLFPQMSTCLDDLFHVMSTSRASKYVFFGQDICIRLSNACRIELHLSLLSLRSPFFSALMESGMSDSLEKYHIVDLSMDWSPLEPEIRDSCVDTNTSSVFDDNLHSNTLKLSSLVSNSENFSLLSESPTRSSSNSPPLHESSNEMRALSDFMRYCYTGICNPTLQTVVPLLSISDRLGMDHLRNLCEKELEHMINADSVHEILHVADTLHCSALLKCCLYYVTHSGAIENDHFLSRERETSNSADSYGSQIPKPGPSPIELPIHSHIIVSTSDIELDENCTHFIEEDVQGLSLDSVSTLIDTKGIETLRDTHAIALEPQFRPIEEVLASLENEIRISSESLDDVWSVRGPRSRRSRRFVSGVASDSFSKDTNTIVDEDEEGSSIRLVEKSLPELYSSLKDSVFPFRRNGIQSMSSGESNRLQPNLEAEHRIRGSSTLSRSSPTVEVQSRITESRRKLFLEDDFDRRQRPFFDVQRMRHVLETRRQTQAPTVLKYVLGRGKELTLTALRMLGRILLSIITVVLYAPIGFVIGCVGLLNATCCYPDFWFKYFLSDERVHYHRQERNSRSPPRSPDSRSRAHAESIPPVME